MPKGILEFNLPEEQDEFELANNAGKYYSVIWDIDQYMRNQIKYASDDTPELYREIIQMVRDELYNILETNNLNLDK
jgi:molecular chaperone GrpE (heat shock protein)